MVIKHKYSLGTTLIISFLCFSISCTRSVLKSPIEEINRTISLPPKNLQFSMGLGAGQLFYYNPFHNNGLYIKGEGDFWYPYFSLSDKTELHIRLLALRQYIIKNTAIVDSTLILTGPNLALYFGLNSMEYMMNNFGVGLLASINFKSKITNRSWVECEPFYQYYTRNNSYDIGITPRFGYQANTKLALMLSFGFERLRVFSLYQDFANNGNEFYPQFVTKEIVWEMDKYIGRLKTSYSFNYHWSIYGAPEIQYIPLFEQICWYIISGFAVQW